MGGKAGIPPGVAARAELGPSRACFCWLRCASCSWARSTSMKTGAKRRMELVKKIHEALQVNLNKDLTLRLDKSVTVEQTLRTGSGNISVRPHSRSPKVSSGSWDKKMQYFWLPDRMWGYDQLTSSKFSPAPSPSAFVMAFEDSWKVLGQDSVSFQGQDCWEMGENVLEKILICPYIFLTFRCFIFAAAHWYNSTIFIHKTNVRVWIHQINKQDLSIFTAFHKFSHIYCLCFSLLLSQNFPSNSTKHAPAL